MALDWDPAPLRNYGHMESSKSLHAELRILEQPFCGGRSWMWGRGRRQVGADDVPSIKLLQIPG